MGPLSLQSLGLCRRELMDEDLCSRPSNNWEHIRLRAEHHAPTSPCPEPASVALSPQCPQGCCLLCLPPAKWDVQKSSLAQALLRQQANKSCQLGDAVERKPTVSIPQQTHECACTHLLVQPVSKGHTRVQSPPGRFCSAVCITEEQNWQDDGPRSFQCLSLCLSFFSF